MADISADRRANRLYITLDKLDRDQAEAIVAEIETELETLSPGFGVVNDVREFKPLSQDAAEHIADAKALLVDAGVDTIVRVVGDSVLGSMQIDRVGDAEYDLVEATSVEDADAELDA